MGCKVYDLIEADKMLFQFGYCEVPDLWRRNERNILPQTYVVEMNMYVCMYVYICMSFSLMRHCNIASLHQLGICHNNVTVDNTGLYVCMYVCAYVCMYERIFY